MIRQRLKEHDMQDKIKDDKAVVNYSEDELNYLKTTFGKSSYSSSGQEIVKDKSVPRHKQYVKCKICGKFYQRCSVTWHRRTQRHKIYAKVNEKLVNLLTEGI